MSRIGELGRGLVKVLIPTPLQAVLVLVAAFWLLVIANLPAIMTRVGITNAGVDSARSSVINFLNSNLGTGLLANVALVAFWAGVGLVVYLICWSVYNLYVQMHNQVTLETSYRNRGPVVALVLPLVLNALSGAALIIYLLDFGGGLQRWLAGSQPAIQSLNVSTGLLAGAALLGLALQLYLLLVLIQLTVTHWYGRAFTD